MSKGQTIQEQIDQNRQRQAELTTKLSILDKDLQQANFDLDQIEKKKQPLLGPALVDKDPGKLADLRGLNEKKLNLSIQLDDLNAAKELASNEMDGLQSQEKQLLQGLSYESLDKEQARHRELLKKLVDELLPQLAAHFQAITDSNEKRHDLARDAGESNHMKFIEDTVHWFHLLDAIEPSIPRTPAHTPLIKISRILERVEAFRRGRETDGNISTIGHAPEIPEIQQVI